MTAPSLPSKWSLLFKGTSTLIVGSYSYHKVHFHTHILLDALLSPSHWVSD